MLLLYILGVRLYRIFIILASPFNKKASLWISGRKNIFNSISNALGKDEKRVWFHCASLGEFEQGRPLIESYKSKYPEHKIVLTFFSPSGYEIRKNYPGADYIFYLPSDSKKNAEKFLNIIQPEKVFFIKYEFWYFYLSVLNKRKTPTYVVSAIFRKNQVFFKWYGGLFRKILKQLTFIFVQNESSEVLLKSIGVYNVLISGDTRFDRVLSIALNKKSIPIIESFKGDKKIFIAGSTWPDDEKILVSLIEKSRTEFQNIKFIIAPHEIETHRINNLLEELNKKTKAVKFSENNSDFENEEVLVIDNIGMLSSLYGYADFAYIGGGFGAGIHNILEAAVFGCALFFGPNYHRFAEANDLVLSQGAFPVTSTEDLFNYFSSLLKNQNSLQHIKENNISYVERKTGATKKILNSTEEKK